MFKKKKEDEIEELLHLIKPIITYTISRTCSILS